MGIRDRYRSDGMIRSTFAVLGPVEYRVPDDAVADKTMKVRVVQRDTGIEASRCCLEDVYKRQEETA